MVGGLFDEPSSFDRDGLAEKLRALAAQNIYIGGSSWKYEGWLGQIYSRDRYLTRGKFSQKMFQQECLREYAETFPTVCGDFAFYQFPTDEFWKRLFTRVPEQFRFAFKAPEQITCKMFPRHARYGPQAGRENENFLDSRMVREMFLRPLLPYREKTALLIFEFGAFGQRSFADVGEFIARLDPFLAALPPEFRYAVEIRNPEFLEKDYFACLRARGVAHVYNAWSKMPELRSQMAIPESMTADFLVSRALLRHGRVYEDAVGMFAPYTEIQDENREARESMRVLIGRAREDRKFLFLFVNNRLEGNAPLTILSLVEK
ncbi:MAG TPA: DUF72 domain-containing protein [Bryobacteraceae bacterium]|jgi:uncharacterized protein YecE (DUF72 family)|nr:DUF72 domain-containing protein [Bryobacteraceae bacterium]